MNLPNCNDLSYDNSLLEESVSQFTTVYWGRAMFSVVSVIKNKFRTKINMYK